MWLVEKKKRELRSALSPFRALFSSRPHALSLLRARERESVKKRGRPPLFAILFLKEEIEIFVLRYL
jgi:hypothetical protein